MRRMLVQDASMTNTQAKRLLSRDEIEDEYGLSRRWLELAALRGDGPPMRKISARMVRYERAEFEDWLKARRVISTSDVVA
ncbi:MAG: putative DNA-binding transcriptional regulator AlpA [Paracoccaceae bacterium]|jgi:predicted DNA-binding transcriptional regulator AlpA